MELIQSEASQPTREVNIGRWLSEGWRLIESDLGFFFLLGFVYLGIITLVGSTIVGWFVVEGPLRVGFFYILFRKLRGGPVDIGMIAKGFEFFMAAALSSVVITLFTGFGLIFCIIPGLILMTLYMFTAPFILTRNLDFWQAMEASRKVIKEHLFDFFMFMIIQGIIILIGALFCLIGIFIAVPLCLAATAVAFRDMVGGENEESAV